MSRLESKLHIHHFHDLFNTWTASLRQTKAAYPAAVCGSCLHGKDQSNGRNMGAEKYPLKSPDPQLPEKPDADGGKRYNRACTTLRNVGDCQCLTCAVDW